MLKDATIDIKSIIEDTLCNKNKVIPMSLDVDVSNEIENLRMVARKGQDNLPQHIIDKMKKKHRDSDDKERSEEHTSELQSRGHLVCRLLLEKKKNKHKFT